MQYEVENIESARKFLANTQEKIILTNPEGSVKLYGIDTIDYIFKTLKEEFPHKISRVVINVFDNLDAFLPAKQKGYKYIDFIDMH